MSREASERARMPAGASSVLESRTLQNSYPTLIPLLKKGMRVLDIGCGTGAISAGIAKLTGPDGWVTGIDSSDHLIAAGKKDHAGIPNLELLETDLFTYQPDAVFDLVVSARVLQWLHNPEEALLTLKKFLRPHGLLSILDYNHRTIAWQPDPPASMLRFYDAFLDWRSEAGMDNEIADHLPACFQKLGFHSIESIQADELYERGQESFMEKMGIWSKVAETRGLQMVKSGHISDPQRLAAIGEYNSWIKEKAESMVLTLKEVRAVIY